MIYHFPCRHKPNYLAKKIRDLGKKHQVLLVEGGAGTGKSTLLRALAELYSHPLVVAPTGIAASFVGGFTLHSAFRISQETPVVSSVSIKRNHADFLRQREIVIVDEVSMVRADVMDAANACLQNVCENKKPFGGKPVVLFGDLYQLPPVLTKLDEPTFTGMGYDSRYFFGARILQRLSVSRLTLVHNWRQSGDTAFYSILNRLRTGSQTQEDLDELNKHCQPFSISECNQRPFLTTRNDRAEQINAKALLGVAGKDLGEVLAILKGDGLTENQAKKNFLAPVKLKLKTNARYMVLKNGIYGSQKVYNGTMGTLTDYSIDEDGEDKVSLLPDGSSSPIEIYRAQWTLKRLRGGKVIEWAMSQFPIKPAYAITIHKCQGMTLDSATVDFKHGAFEHGQLYVALSRLSNLNNLYLTQEISDSDILVDAKISNFLNGLTNTNLT